PPTSAPPMPYVLGLDVSTTATKALLLDPAGEVVADAAIEYPYETPLPPWSEQDPALWWDGSARSIRTALAEAGVASEEIVAVWARGQMLGIVLLAAAGAVLRPDILWNDAHNGAEIDAIRGLVGKERLVAVTGNVALTGFTAVKLLWLRAHAPDVYAPARQV